MDDADIYRLLGRNIAAHRKKRKLSQAQVAERIGLTRASLANIETGRQRAMLHHVYELVDALGLSSITELLPRRVPQSLIQSSQGAAEGPASDQINFVGEKLSPVEKAQLEHVISKVFPMKFSRRR